MIELADDGAKPSNPKDSIGVRKAGYSCLPMRVVAEAGVGMLEGACRYGRHNYRAVGVRASVYYDASMRHINAWWEGEDIDPDSSAQLHHVTKAITSLMVLRDAMIRGKVEDDRPPSSADYSKELDEAAAKLIDQHADKHPRHYTIQDEDHNLRGGYIIPPVKPASVVFRSITQSVPAGFFEQPHQP